MVAAEIAGRAVVRGPSAFLYHRRFVAFAPAFAPRLHNVGMRVVAVRDVAVRHVRVWKVDVGVVRVRYVPMWPVPMRKMAVRSVPVPPPSGDQAGSEIQSSGTTLRHALPSLEELH